MHSLMQSDTSFHNLLSGTCVIPFKLNINAPIATNKSKSPRKETDVKTVNIPPTPYSPYAMDTYQTQLNDTPLPERSPLLNNGYSFGSLKDHTTMLSDDDEEYSDHKSINSESDDIPLIDLASELNNTSEDIEFAENGYRKIAVISETLQGQLYKAEVLNSPSPQYVAIKKCDKALLSENIAIQDGINFIVSENMIKEAVILKHLTFNNSPIGGYLVNYIDFFESDDSYYLVMEYIESEMNLKQFVQTAFKYIGENKMKLSHYQQIIKYLYWQLVVTIRWLHHDMKCCHLDLCLENIMLSDVKFTKQKDNTYMIDLGISIKLSDFGVAELFRDDKFGCCKLDLSLDNEATLSPEILGNDGPYNATKADIWSLGIILFECMTGKQLYDASADKQHDPYLIMQPNGYYQLNHCLLKECLKRNNLLKYFKKQSVSILSGLLDTNQSTRFDSNDIIQHKWFSSYYKKYHKQIQRKSMNQSQALSKQKVIMKGLPYYQL